MSRNQNDTSFRYSDEDLEVFKQVFEEKLSLTQKEQQQLLAMLAEESDESSKELITQFLQRHDELIDHINKSLIRIDNKTFGINKKTGELIDREELLALPHGKQKLD